MLQVYSGGRSGLLVSAIVSLYFGYCVKRMHGLLMAAAYLTFVIVAGAVLSPLPDLFPGTHVFRAIIWPDDLSFFAWLDYLSSFRLGIMWSALGSLDAWSLLFGKGVMHFKGSAIGEVWDVHNIYVRALGELGGGGCLVLCALVALPHRAISGNARIRLAQIFCLACVLVGMIHPEFLTTAISTCMIFWLCYGEVLRQRSLSAATQTAVD
jgi:hypothetical protein